MLQAFIARHRQEIIQRCRAKVALRMVPPPTPAEVDHGVPVFLDQLTEALRLGLDSSPEIGTSSVKHGHDLLRQGFTVSQVVHDYGNVCQSIIELAIETETPISPRDFGLLNRCLDEAIAGAVTEFGREQNLSTRAEESARGSERVGFLAHELRNLLHTAVMAFEILQTGNVGVAGSTGAILHRSLVGARALIGRSLAELRLTQSVQNREQFLVSAFIDELAPAATLEAGGHGIGLTVIPVDDGVADRGRSPDPRCRGGQPAAERVQIHPPSEHRGRQSRRQHRSGVDRGPGRMRRPPGRNRARPVPAVRTAQCRSQRSGSRARVQPVGRRSQQRPALRTEPA